MDCSSIYVKTTVFLCYFGNGSSFCSVVGSTSTPSFAHMISRAKPVESSLGSKKSEVGKKGKKPTQILLSTSGGRRYWVAHISFIGLSICDAFICVYCYGIRCVCRSRTQCCSLSYIMSNGTVFAFHWIFPADVSNWELLVSLLLTW